MKMSTEKFYWETEYLVFHSSTECKMWSYFPYCAASVFLTHMEIPTHFEFSGKIPLNFKQNT